MAQVFRAYHPQLDRYVAIKVLRADLVEDEEFLTRFQREARAVAALRHPNIVQVYDFDVQEGDYYMVMELLEGDTLKARLNDYRLRSEQIPLGEVVRIILDVLDGLAYAHSEGMIHRDIKPANILLSKRGQAVIGDFGIAQIIGGTRHTATGALMGTLHYIAPEQGLEGRSDARSDIYSLGIVLYEMFTGAPPFDADTPLAILMKHLNDPLPLPRQIDASIPEPFERVILKALSKDPEARFQGAGEMAEALRAAAEQAEIELPSRISLPLSFKTAEAPSESVAVLSGASREKVTDVQFAADETDATLGKKLEEERAAAMATQTQASTAQPAAEGEDLSPTAVRSLKRHWAGESNLWKSVPAAIGILIGANLLVVMLGILTKRWAFGRGWAMEPLLVGLLLCTIMAASGLTGMIIPTAIVLGNGILLTYSALTNWWGQWAFLWILEPALVFGSIWLLTWLNKQEDRASQLELIAFTLWRIAIVLILANIVGGFIFG
jgi:serine/threonine protein kinase